MLQVLEGCGLVALLLDLCDDAALQTYLARVQQICHEFFCRPCSGACCVGAYAGQGMSKNVKLQTPIVGGYPERSIDRACIDADDACAYAWLTGYDPALADEERGVLAEKAHSWAPEERDKIRGGPPRPNEIVPYGIKGNCLIVGARTRGIEHRPVVG